MSTLARALLLALLAGVAPALHADDPAPPAAAEAIVWLDSYPAALEQARAQNKPVLLYFHADG